MTRDLERSRSRMGHSLPDSVISTLRGTSCQCVPPAVFRERSINVMFAVMSVATAYGERRRPARCLRYHQEPLWYGQTGRAQWSLPCLPQGEVQKDLAVTGAPACGPSVNNAASGNERCREVRRRDGGKRSALALSLFPDRLSRAGGWPLRPRPAFFL